MGFWNRSSCARFVGALGIITITGCATNQAPTPLAFIGSTSSVTVSYTAKTMPPIALPRAQVRPVSTAFPPLRNELPLPTPGDATTDVRVMSFNCRVSTLFDLHNTWGLRKGLLLDTIQNFNPDLLGTQECVASQSDYLRAKLDGYDFVGAGRDDGKRDGEMCGVFFRADKFQKLDAGHFWLSQSPSKPGSKGWGAFFPRMVTWVKLQPRDGGTPFVWFNTHLDAFSSRARLNGARLLRARMAAIAGTLPTLVTGDFNADAGSDPYRTLIGPAGTARMTDTFRAVNPSPVKGDGTRHAFRGGCGGPRIDWILASSAAFDTVDADINHTKSGLIYPSDHFPVTAVLRPLAAPALASVE